MIFPERPQIAADVAAALYEIAERFAALGGAPLPDLYVSMDIQPSGGQDVEVAAIDMIGQALHGEPGETKRMSSGNYHHIVGGRVAGIRIDTYTRVRPQRERELLDEIDRLRAHLGEREGDAR